VSFRFLRHWGELSLYLSANQQSYLLPYTINNFRALIQSNLHDNSLLAYFTSNILLMLHLLRKVRATVTTHNDTHGTHDDTLNDTTQN
jgi:hypothetical protein